MTDAVLDHVEEPVNSIKHCTWPEAALEFLNNLSAEGADLRLEHVNTEERPGYLERIADGADHTGFATIKRKIETNAYKSPKSFIAEPCLWKLHCLIRSRQSSIIEGTSNVGRAWQIHRVASSGNFNFRARTYDKAWCWHPENKCCLTPFVMR